MGGFIKLPRPEAQEEVGRGGNESLLVLSWKTLWVVYPSGNKSSVDDLSIMSLQCQDILHRILISKRYLQVANASDEKRCAKHSAALSWMQASYVKAVCGFEVLELRKLQPWLRGKPVHKQDLAGISMQAIKNEPKSKYDLYFVPISPDHPRTPHVTGFWQCDKCADTFTSFKGLKVHKRKVHSY